MKPILYHNAACSTSRNAIQLLTENGIDFTVREYLKDLLSRDELKELLARLSLPASAIVRKKGADYEEAGIADDAPESEWFELLMAHPKLMQRPIVEMNGKAIVARPVGKALEFLKP